MIYLELFLTFLKIGAFTFGGGYAMIPLIQEEVLKKNWLDEERIINFIAVSESTPGPFAVNISTYVGMETAGFLGSMAATFGVVLPSFLIILMVAKCYTKFKNSKIVKGCMKGLKPAVIGFIAWAFLSTSKIVFFPIEISFHVIKTYGFISAFLIFIVAFILSLRKVHPIFIILLSGLLGMISFSLKEFFNL